MTKKAPGKSHRKGLSLAKLFRRFQDDETARNWIESIIWPDGPRCPHCGSHNVQSGIKHKSMTHRCRECDGRPRFSVKTGTVMQSSKLGYQTWAVAAYLVTTSLKSVSSMKLHRDLDITQKSAWHLAHRLRKTYEAGMPMFSGPVETDETWIGGREHNKHKCKKLKAGRGTVGKTAVVGMKDRGTNQISAKAVESVDRNTLHDFVEKRTEESASVFTDDASAYRSMKRAHETVNHSTGEYVRDMIHTNGVESFWSMLKRAHKGTFHKFSPKHLDRYVSEFAGRHNVRNADTIMQMAAMTHGMIGKRLRYTDLTTDNGLDSGARS